MSICASGRGFTVVHKTFTREKTPVKSVNSGKHNFTIDYIHPTRGFLRLKFYAIGPKCVINVLFVYEG